MIYVAIMKVDGSGNVEKFQGFDLLADAQDHVDTFIEQFPDAYAVSRPTGGPRDWVADTVAETLVYSDVLAVAEAITTKQEAVDTLRDMDKLNAGITFNGKTWKADKLSAGGMAEKSDRYTELNSATARVITGATQANPVVVSYTGDPIPDGELVQVTAIVGMTELNGNNYRFKNGGTGTAELYEASGVGYAPVDGAAFTAYTSGGLGNIFVCWIAEDNTVARLSFADFKLLRRHVNTYLSYCIEAARKHKNAIAELADVAAVDSYSITTDWPSSTF